ncbi:MAG: cysteine--tRNA ligase [Patescibacteria group bacterium]
MALILYNSLSRDKEMFEPLGHTGTVGLYTCGPTVYDYVTIGNWRTYTLGDITARVLSFDGYAVKYFMNITDVGHLTGDNEGDADTGEDRMEKAKKREGKTAWDVAHFYADDFLIGYKKLNLFPPEKFLKATDYIPEQIALVERLMDHDLAYAIDDGIYFNTAAYEARGFMYGELSNLDHIKAGARVEFNPEKKNPRDFALWKFSPKDEKRDMEWESPWDIGFPGWHIECSAMSMKFLGEQFDIHVGGEDLKSTHHPNEIAQSQGATGMVPFVKYWIHGAFLQVDGGRMGKSLGNAYTLHDIEKKGINPLALRYFYMTSHYRSPLNFTWEGLEASQNALHKLYKEYKKLSQGSNSTTSMAHVEKFTEALNDDLNLPKALAVLWELIKDDTIADADKKETLLRLDTVLGFNLSSLKEEIIPVEVTRLVALREQARRDKKWQESDAFRANIKALGFDIVDTDHGPVVSPLS